jgi:hypothetical protein
MHSYNTRHSTYAAAVSASTAPTVSDPTSVIVDAPPVVPTPVAPTTPANDAPPPVTTGAPPPTTLNAVIANAIDGITAHTAESQPQFPVSVVQDQHNPTVDCYFAPGVVEDQVPTVPVVSPVNAAAPPPPSTPTPPTKAAATVSTDATAAADGDDEKEEEKKEGSVEGVHLNAPLDTVPFSSPKSLSLVKVAPTEGARFAEGTTNHSRKYTNRKKKLLNEFVEVLRSHPEKYARYIVLTTDIPPSFPSNEPTEVVFVLLRGDENRADKVRQLNAMIIDWVSDKRLKKNPLNGGSCFPAPASLNTMIRTFFASAKDYYQWSYSQKDFCFDGGYNGFFAALCKKRRAEDVSCCCCFFFEIFLKFIHSNNSFYSNTASVWQQIRKCPPVCRGCRENRPFQI